MTEDELNAENTAVALVGKGTPFTILEGKELEPYLATLKAEEDTAPGLHTFASQFWSLLLCLQAHLCVCKAYHGTAGDRDV